MIDLYTWSTPNGRKVSIMLEELGVPYNTKPINIFKDEQHSAEFLAISPNNKIPAIVDGDTGMTLMESGAILVYLADKYGRFMPGEGQARWRALEWLMWQVGGIGPFLGQANHFLHFKPGQAPYAEKRYAAEARRLYGVLDRRLDGRDYVVDDYSIVDKAIWPWLARFEWHQIDLDDYANVRDWYVRIAQRPAVQRGYRVPNPEYDIPLPG